MTDLPVPSWRQDPQAFEQLIAEQLARESHTGQSRVSLEVPGCDAPVLIDRWEFEAFGAKTRGAERLRLAVALRTLCRELRVTFEGRDSLDPSVRSELIDRVESILKQSLETQDALNRLGDMDKGPQGRKYHLTRDKLDRESEMLGELYEKAGFKSPVARAKARAAAQPKDDSSSSLAASVSGAFERAKEGMADESATWKKALVPVLFLLAIGIAAYNLRPKPDLREPISMTAYSAISPVNAMWKKKDTVGGEVTTTWYAVDEEGQRTNAEKMYAVARKQGAKRLLLYQSGGEVLAATVTEEGVQVFPPRVR